MSIGPNTKGRDFNFFKKVSVNTYVFNDSPDVLLTSSDFQNLSFINEGSASVYFSFNGNTIHGDLTPGTASASIVITDPGATKIWFKVNAGISTTIRVQTNAYPSIGGYAGGVPGSELSVGLTGALQPGYATLIAGSDGYKLNYLSVDTNGIAQIKGTITANQGTSPWITRIGDGTNLLSLYNSNLTGNEYALPVRTIQSAPTTNSLSGLAINFAASGDNIVIPNSLGKKTRVFKMFLITTADTQLILKDGAGINLTGQMLVFAGGGMTLDFDSESWFTLTTSNDFIINSTAASQISGRIYYTQV